MTYKEFCLEVSKKAGLIMKEYFKKDETSFESKSDMTIVTEADKAINKLVIQEVKKNYPGHGVIGEEESYLSDSEYQWVVDPIDGTSMFSIGVPTNVFALALCQNKTPVISCVFNPYTDETWLSEDEKAYCNSKPITCMPDDFSKNKRLIIGICTEKSSKYNLHKVPEYLCDNLNASIVNLRSTIYMDMLVASGKIAGNIAFSNHGHDCIGSMIVEMAGGKTTCTKGTEIRLTSKNDGYVSSNGVIHDQLLEILKMFEN